jgi:uncharacterized delta-60 repeat protein
MTRSPLDRSLEPLEPRTLLAAAAGDLDPAFGVDGVRVYDDIPAPAVGLATQSDGKFLVATESTLYRFKPDGSLDKSFGTRGHVTPGFTLHGLGVDHHGKIAVGGGTADFQWAAARYNPDGSPDTTFNHTGQIITRANGDTEDHASVMTLQPDGKILVGGVRFNGNTDDDPDFDYNAAVVRFNTDGSIDTAFGTNGEAFDTPVFNAVNTIAVAPNGDIAIAGEQNIGMARHQEWFQVATAAGRVVAGTPPTTDNPGYFTRYRAAWYRPDGTRVLADEAMGNSFVSFDDRGVGVWFNPLAPAGYTDEKVNAIVTTADNKTLLAGLDYGGNLGLLRFNPDATPDSTFGFGGSSNIDLNRRKTEWIDRLALLPDGDLLAAGTIGGTFPDNPSPDARLFIARIKGGAHPVGNLPPRAAFDIDRPAAGTTQFEFTVTYAAEETIDKSSLGGRDVRVVGPGGYSALARLTHLDDRYAGRHVIATYTIDAPGGTWNRADNGRYTVYLRTDQVSDNRGHAAPAGVIGGFKVYFPRGRHHTATTTAAVTRALAAPAAAPGDTLPNITDTATDAAGNVYRTGTFTGTVDFDPSPTATTNLTAQSTDDYIAKFTPDGRLLWARSFGSSQAMGQPRLGVSPAGDAYLTADFAADFEIGHSPSGRSIVFHRGTERNLYVLHLDPDGNPLHDNAFVTPGQDMTAVDVATTPDGHVALVANSTVPGIQSSDDYKGDAHFYLLNFRLRTAVHHRWAEFLASTPGVVEARSLAVSPTSGAVYIAGATAPDVDFAPGHRVRKVSGSLTDSPFLLRLAPSGRFDWVVGYETAFPATLWIDRIDPDDAVHVSGNYVSARVDFNPSPRKQFILTAPNGGDSPDATYTALFSPRGALLSAQDTTSVT